MGNSMSDLEDNPLPTDPNAKKITDLNDCCLENIFERLNLKSLFNVAVANEFLRPAAAKVYKRRFGRHRILISGYLFERHGRPLYELSLGYDLWGNNCVNDLRSVLQFLRCFGQQITELEFCGYYYIKKRRYQYVNQYINKYCSKNLVSIRFESLPKIAKSHFRKPFVNVQDVTVHGGCLGRYLPSFAKWFPNMRRLELIHVNMFQNRLTDLRFPHLEHFIVPYMAKRNLKDLKMLKVNAAGIKRFINNHPRLVELDLPYYHFTLKAASKVVRRLNLLTKFRFSLDVSQYKRFVKPLKRQWECSGKCTDGIPRDKICVTMTKRAP